MRIQMRPDLLIRAQDFIQEIFEGVYQNIFLIGTQNGLQ